MSSDTQLVEILPEVLRSSFSFFMEDVYTCVPARIVAIRSYEQQLVDVKPLINIITPEDQVLERAVILGVPYIFPATLTSALILPVIVGDTVWLMFSMRALESFKQGSGLPQAPLNFSRFDKKDAVAIVGLFPQRLAPNDPRKHTNPHFFGDTVLVHNYGTPDEVEIRMSDGAKITINCKEAVVNADNTELNTDTLAVNAGSTTWTGNIALSGNLTQSGTYTLDGVNMNDHKHKVENVQSGGSTIISKEPE